MYDFVCLTHTSLKSKDTLRTVESC